MTENQDLDRDHVILEMIRCPNSGSKLDFPESEFIQLLNERIEKRELYDQIGRVVEHPIETGVVNADRSLLYPVTKGVFRLIKQDAIKICFESD